MYSQVLNHQIDVAFVLASDTLASGLERTLLAEESVVVVASPEHPLSRKKQVMATDLRDETILLTEPGCSYRKLFEDTPAASGIYPGCRMERGTNYQNSSGSLSFGKFLPPCMLYSC